MISNVAWGVIAAAGVAVAGTAVFVLRDQAGQGTPPPAAEVEEAPVAEANAPQPEAQAEEVTVATPTPEAPADVVLPSLDVVRVDPNGAAVVAGTGPATADIILRLDGEEIAAQRSDRAGNFVSLFDIPVGDVPRILSAEARTENGTILRATESVIVAPVFPQAPAVPEAPEIVAQETLPDADETPAETSEEVAVDASAEAAPAVAEVVVEADTRAVEPPSEEPPRVEAADAETPAQSEADVSEAQVDATPTPQTPAEEVVVATPPTTAQDAPPVEVAIADAPRVEIAPPKRPQPGTVNIATPAAPSVQASAVVSETPSAPRLFRAGPSGVTLIAEGPADQPQVVEDLGIDAISYDAEGDVQLAGRGQSDSELRIYLNNQPVLNVTVGPDGEWSSPLPNIETGVYTLRVDEVDAEGSVISRVETPFQRTAPEIAAQARRDGLTAITVQPGYTLWAISEGYFGEGVQYVQIFEANRSLIKDPDLIYPGQVFALPTEDSAN